MEWPTIQDRSFPLLPLFGGIGNNLYNKIPATKHITQKCNKKTTIYNKKVNP